MEREQSWAEHIELLKEISYTLLNKAKELTDKNDLDTAFKCISESRKCVELALKFRLMTKTLSQIDVFIEQDIDQLLGIEDNLGRQNIEDTDKLSIDFQIEEDGDE